MKFRVISDIHLDINGQRAPQFGDDVFTVVCGDTSGYPEKTIEWIKKNVRRGVGVSGNHLPYNDDSMPIQALRDQLAAAFPAESDVTYLDAECGVVSKEVDGVLFVGSCFYSDMAIKSDVNPDGDVNTNKLISRRHMNDYKYGIVRAENGAVTQMTPADYVEWNRNALAAFEKIVSENEKLDKPKPVVVVTHYPMVRDVIEHSLYVDRDNFPSYGSDMAEWFGRHPSVKCHCCGHCHDMEKDYRHFKIGRECGDLLVVNNSFGYYHEWHDLTFNPGRFVDTETWEVEEIPEPEEIQKSKKERKERMTRIMAWFI